MVLLSEENWRERSSTSISWLSLRNCIVISCLIRHETGRMYPEEGATCPIDWGELHANPVGPIQHIIPCAVNLAHWHHVVPKIRPNPKLQTGSITVLSRPGPPIDILQRIRKDIVRCSHFAVGTSGIPGRDIVVLRLPPELRPDLGKVQEVALDELREDGIGLAVGGVDRISALAGGQSCTNTR